MYKYKIIITSLLVNLSLLVLTSYSYAIPSCSPASSQCGCRNLSVNQVIQLPNYNFLDTSTSTTYLTLSIECRSNTAGSVTFDVSVNNTSGYILLNAGNSLSFDIFQPNSNTVVLGQGTNAYTHVQPTNSNNYQTFTLSFPTKILENQNVPPAAYSNTYILSVNYPLYQGGNQQDNFPITFQTIVDKACIVSVSDLNFGEYDPNSNIDLTSSGSFIFQCSPGISTSFYLTPIQQGTISDRILTNGPNQLHYNLYTDSNFSTIFGNTNEGSPLSHTTNGNTQSINYYGKIPANQNVQSGTYTDMQSVSIDF
ncbi:spore coat U domain-containing protein [Thiotrichales bacterium 19S3-7]|nr:spore coat U domain-containing protein [Thiotrichales bacterium 19S3-7]MCF6802308.1 spore coat U domain-containing protein [Thiotrichales bacterium 19S3-11]